MRPAHPSYKPSARQLQAELDALRLGKTGPADEGSGENGSRPSDNCKQKTVLVTLEVAEDVADAIRKGAARSVELAPLAAFAAAERPEQSVPPEQLA